MKKDLKALIIWIILYSSLTIGHIFEIPFLINISVGVIWVSVLISIAIFTLVLALTYTSDEIFDHIYGEIEKKPYEFIESKTSTYGTIITSVIASFILAYFGYVALLVFYLILILELHIFVKIVQEIAERIIKIKSN